MARRVTPLTQRKCHGPNPVDRSKPAAGNLAGNVGHYSRRRQSGCGYRGAILTGGVSRYGTESAGNAARTLAYTARARCDFTGGAGRGGVDVVHRHIGRIAERICPFAPPVPRHDDGKTE
ncbi:hypothetical protein D3C76_1567950 [compost metagenome]